LAPPRPPQHSADFVFSTSPNHYLSFPPVFCAVDYFSPCSPPFTCRQPLDQEIGPWLGVAYEKVFPFSPKPSCCDLLTFSPWRFPPGPLPFFSRRSSRGINLEVRSFFPIPGSPGHGFFPVSCGRVFFAPPFQALCCPPRFLRFFPRGLIIGSPGPSLGRRLVVTPSTGPQYDLVLAVPSPRGFSGSRPSPSP